MTCRECGGVGFITFVGDFKSRSGIVSKNTEQVRRCSGYFEYFRRLQLELGLAVEDRAFDGDDVKKHFRVVQQDEWGRLEAYGDAKIIDGGCDAAIARHREVIEQVRGRHAEKTEQGRSRRGAGKARF